MSGFKKVIKRAPYKERSQPGSRKKLGLLEKHKDYSLRAADHNRKKAQLANLREKARNRNEDEFYFGMLSRTGPGSATNAVARGIMGRNWRGTVAGDRGNRTLDTDVVRLLKTQDLGYVRTVRNVAAKEVTRLRQKVSYTEAMLQDRLKAIGLPHQKEVEEENDGVIENADNDDDDDDDDDDDYAISSKSRKSIPSKSKRFSSIQARKIMFVDEASPEIISRVEDTEMEDGNDYNDNASLNPRDNRREEATAIGREFLLKRESQLGRLRRRLQDAEHRLKSLETAENELEQQRARMAKTQTTGVVTKAGKRMKVNVRKR